MTEPTPDTTMDTPDPGGAPEPSAPVPDPGTPETTPQGPEGRQEARDARIRAERDQLRGERDTLASRVAEFQKAEVHRRAEQFLRNPADLDLVVSAEEYAAMWGDDGRMDEGAFAAAMDRALDGRDHWRKPYVSTDATSIRPTAPMGRPEPTHADVFGGGRPR
jgi:hypothetical protein